MADQDRTKAEAAETADVLFEISNLLNTGLDKQTLAILVELIESGVNPEALAHVVKELKREAAVLQQAQRETEAARAFGL